jgi:predicted DNA-binding transcriptional regulator YafY
MSKRGYLSRYMLIVKKLKTKPYSTYQELQGYIDNRFEYYQIHDETLNIGFSKRTLQRDIREIRNLFGVDIEYSKSNKGYFINQTERENLNFQRMMEAFDLFNSLSLAQDLTPFVLLEKRRPQGAENLYGLIHAIKNKLEIRFHYKKFWEEEGSERSVSPYALKEFKSRWYILGCNNKYGSIKCYALDRLTNLEITSKNFEVRKNFDVEEYYRHCYGIISPDQGEPEEIILSFNPFQGKYIKTLPLHETQEIFVDNENELQIKLKLYITFDFMMELLSFGDNMKVLKPVSLVNAVKEAHVKASARYI